jgi:hypothetical protein
MFTTTYSGTSPISDRLQGGSPALIKAAIEDLRTARHRLRDAGANKAADYVARAMKSAEGALRHAQLMADRR